MSLFGFVLILMLRPTSAADIPEELSFQFQGRVATIPISTYDGGKFNIDCIKKSDQCAAIKAYHGVKKKFTQGSWGSASLAYCKAVDSTPVLLKHKNGDESAYCLFDDVSLVNASDLYQKHWGQN